ncbi:coiled-coil domain-containing protein [Endozoicomonas numazuensis]|uniref:hypothetical protein n=1 Tax=Endozoicomonas numazuensis TaxID=1137799 RepID=UPI00068BA183|nr:hypothetical protein [Endozoicomonas numazuensis]
MNFSKKYNENYANFLIRLAWTVEVIAVLIGLTISIVVSISANDSYLNQDSGSLIGNYSSVLVAGLPFLLIAVVELCKIPLTFAFMAVKNVLWRGLFLFFVAFLCLITFETMLNGFERNFSNLNYAIDTRKNDIENIESEIALLNRRQERVQVFTEDDLTQEVESQQLSIDESFRTRINSVNAKTESILSGIDYSFREELDTEIQDLIEQRDGYYADWNIERQGIEDRFSALLLDNLSDSRTEKDRLLDELASLKAEMARELDDANFLTRAAVDSKYRKLIADKNKQVDQITTGYLGGDALTKQANMEDQMKQQIEFTNNKYEGRIADINERIESKKQEIVSREAANVKLQNDVVASAENSRSRYMSIKLNQEKELSGYVEGKQQELGVINTQVVDIEDKVFLLRNDQRNIQSEINRLINQNQVYRLAMYAYGKESPTDVSRKMVGVIALLWFGSLALIASVTGVMLCLAGFYLKREIMRIAEEEEKAEKFAQEALKKASRQIQSEEKPAEAATTC